jgi:hypothetical protein
MCKECENQKVSNLYGYNTWNTDVNLHKKGNPYSRIPNSFLQMLSASALWFQ